MAQGDGVVLSWMERESGSDIVVYCCGNFVTIIVFFGIVQIFPLVREHCCTLIIRNPSWRRAARSETFDSAILAVVCHRQQVGFPISVTARDENTLNGRIQK